METSFCELKGKEVINIVDGKRLGRIIDIVFDTKCGRLLGIVVPCYNKSWNVFKSNDDIFIPFNCICKFGDDAILVQIFIQNQNCSRGKKGKFIQTASVQESQNSQTFVEPQISIGPQENNQNVSTSNQTPNQYNQNANYTNNNIQ